ncbi:hypothetical protein BDZ91DRAFT_796598 [Kalaharituber pfeilii]|nr:hypothetical protein BDZ91DRAFT_796598 [Kalaharituber pfeilii]
MRIPDANPIALQRASMGFHALQAVFIPIIMGVTAASLLQKPSALSAAEYMFSMCWLTIPALIYVMMTPRFARTKPLANPYAICGFNSLLCFLWFIAPIALGTANRKRQQDRYDYLVQRNKEDSTQEKPSGVSCDILEFPKECSLNNAAVGLGVCMFLFLLATTLMSIYVALYYRANLITPWEAHSAQIGGEQVTEHTKHAFGDDDGTGGDYALIAEEDRTHQNPSIVHSTLTGEQYYDADYERQMAREGEAQRSRSVGSGSYDAGRVGFPDGDYSYTGR